MTVVHGDATDPQMAQEPNRCHQMPPSPVKVPVCNLQDPGQVITKKLLPIAGFFVAFATVMTVLILYMDNTAMKHHQFTLNLSKDMELNGISQDDTQLIIYLREMAISPAIEPHHKPLESLNVMSNETEYLLKIFNNKKNGIFVESGAYSDGKTSKTEVLERQYEWKGLLIQPDPRHYFNLRRHNRVRSQCIHACLSPMPYPREITLHGETDVKINSIYSNSVDNPDWLVTRVKCFPLYSLLLAMNYKSVDFLSVESSGTELQVLETIPFNKVKIEVISVDVRENDSEIGTIKKFLATKNYKFMEKFNSNYMFVLNRVKI
ncbi:protein Star [Sitophilus oryzae]|uniref:Protein Star n=1 Tax=Sitophilus oryzae TaxID=7048 RepID=A0A6J2YYU7_SITOR|nr:protein Star [Sitophilus oryzae]XP_030768351.1 protein Star [Sitophilus oryzae]XP_030768352.1 protein Star [Sitophilus oryzae]